MTNDNRYEGLRKKGRTSQQKKSAGRKSGNATANRS